MKHMGEHACKNISVRSMSSFNASKILGTPFPVYLHDGVQEKFCKDCGTILGHVIAQPKELIAIVAILRAFKPCKLNGEEIRFLRKSLGLKSKQLAKEISISAETLSRFENNKQPMSEASEKLLRAAVCLRHVKEAQGQDVDIAGLFSMKIPSVWSCENAIEFHLTMEPAPYCAAVRNDAAEEEHTKWFKSENRKEAC